MKLILTNFLRCLFSQVFQKIFYTHIPAERQSKCHYERGARIFQKPRCHLNSTVFLKCNML